MQRTPAELLSTDFFLIPVIIFAIFLGFIVLLFIIAIIYRHHLMKKYGIGFLPYGAQTIVITQPTGQNQQNELMPGVEIIPGMNSFDRRQQFALLQQPPQQDYLPGAPASAPAMPPPYPVDSQKS
ncbi:unnamed protein product [Gongylonema pulchrum]|uniref:Uncharacterized protein n=1 Tax=Gongylonema pulchrum TaxID=637853 RepID=A0A183DVF3_9BILA|nr:unnamed protein product [Gongylonema pulchrum]